MISVIIPVYNGAAYLGEAIQSVLEQTYQPFEIIVVDDGSTDNSADIARAFGAAVRCLSVEHGGAAAARNAGIAQAQGEWLAFLDADDLWLPDKLEQQLQMAAADPQLGAVIGLFESFFSAELDPEDQQKIEIPTHGQVGYSAVALLVRKAVFLRVGNFNPALRSGEFIDWWARAGEQGVKVGVLPAVVFRRRLHGQNHTLQRPETFQDYARVARAALQRRRNSS